MTKGELIKRIASLPDDAPIMVDEGDWGHSRIDDVFIEQCSDSTLVAVLGLEDKEKK